MALPQQQSRDTRALRRGRPGERGRSRTGVMAGRRMRDDRVLAETRVLGAVIVPFLLVAFGLLYLFPDDTRHWFAWDVRPTLTPLIRDARGPHGAHRSASRGAIAER